MTADKSELSVKQEWESLVRKKISSSETERTEYMYSISEKYLFKSHYNPHPSEGSQDSQQRKIFKCKRLFLISLHFLAMGHIKQLSGTLF